MRATTVVHNDGGATVLMLARRDDEVDTFIKKELRVNRLDPNCECWLGRRTRHGHVAAQIHVAPRQQGLGAQNPALGGSESAS